MMNQATDKLVEQKAKYTKQVDVKTKAVKSKQKEIEELKHAGEVFFLYTRPIRDTERGEKRIVPRSVPHSLFYDGDYFNAWPLSLLCALFWVVIIRAARGRVYVNAGTTQDTVSGIGGGVRDGLEGG
jgi:hypothetical protein